MNSSILNIFLNIRYNRFLEKHFLLFGDNSKIFYIVFLVLKNLLVLFVLFLYSFISNEKLLPYSLSNIFIPGMYLVFFFFLPDIWLNEKNDFYIGKYLESGLFSHNTQKSLTNRFKKIYSFIYSSILSIAIIFTLLLEFLSKKKIDINYLLINMFLIILIFVAYYIRLRIKTLKGSFFKIASVIMLLYLKFFDINFNFKSSLEITQDATSLLGVTVVTSLMYMLFQHIYRRKAIKINFDQKINFKHSIINDFFKKEVYSKFSMWIILSILYRLLKDKFIYLELVYSVLLFVMFSPFNLRYVLNDNIFYFLNLIKPNYNLFLTYLVKILFPYQLIVFLISGYVVTDNFLEFVWFIAISIVIFSIQSFLHYYIYISGYKLKKEINEKVKYIETFSWFSLVIPILIFIFSNF